MNRQYLVEPTLFRALGQVKGKRIMDAGYENGISADYSPRREQR